MIWLLVLLILVLPFGLAVWRGAPYVPIVRRDYEPVLDLAELKPGQTILDLGSGDGRLLRAAAQRGYQGVGYEINPFVYVVSLFVTWRYRRLVTIHLGDFWAAPVTSADAIYVFLIDRLMSRLDAKLTAEIKHSTPVVSFVFAIPGRTPDKTTRNAFRYQYPAR
jgi:SAM-dependent methyltransferase